MGHVMPTSSGTSEDSCDCEIMPTLGPFVAPRQYEESLLMWKARLLPTFTATGKDLLSHSK